MVATLAIGEFDVEASSVCSTQNGKLDWGETFIPPEGWDSELLWQLSVWGPSPKCASCLIECHARYQPGSGPWRPHCFGLPFMNLSPSGLS